MPGLWPLGSHLCSHHRHPSGPGPPHRDSSGHPGHPGSPLPLRPSSPPHPHNPISQTDQRSPFPGDLGLSRAAASSFGEGPRQDQGGGRETAGGLMVRQHAGPPPRVSVAPSSPSADVGPQPPRPASQLLTERTLGETRRGDTASWDTSRAGLGQLGLRANNSPEQTAAQHQQAQGGGRGPPKLGLAHCPWLLTSGSLPPLSQLHCPRLQKGHEHLSGGLAASRSQMPLTPRAGPGTREPFPCRPSDLDTGRCQASASAPQIGSLGRLLVPLPRGTPGSTCGNGG